ncbi:putative membrane protein (TIGR02234 family) [Nocardioides daedukensis]|uniref:Putative membrane protein (TIGR02234 family) n=1 Tax=Nocardioides daedukensis TaxID=634462 RepID=A0A7Y9UP75_9ACTN|nr:Trp biosynthesis-associated membrane protein [Nocardioides daedukensis]NYG57942.1 putative membrane protein (TIGR02234 family) [Nocardioides daedukensis]
MPEPRKTFGPIVLLGLSAGTLCAVAGSKDWAALDDTEELAQNPAASQLLETGTAAEMPLAAALSLVVLALWGVLLVTRGVVRRVVAVLATLASLGLLATVVAGHSSTRNGVEQAFADIGVETTVHITGWWWAALVGAVLAVLAGILAARHAPHWPAMGSRYDAPGAAAAGPVRVDEANTTELWKAIDEGHDPTA